MNHPISSTIRRPAAACVLSILFGFAAHASAGENSPEILKIFSFAGAGTSAAMRNGHYERVIRGGRSKFVDYGYHDLVNLCAAYALRDRLAEAERACSRAITHQPVSTRRPAGAITPQRWVAYANRSVVRELLGDAGGAQRDLAFALQRGGDPTALAGRADANVLVSTSGP